MLLRLTPLLLISLSACGPRELRFTMNADNNSGQGGFAVIQDLGATLTITVETTVPEFISSTGQLAHLHKGTCGESARSSPGSIDSSRSRETRAASAAPPPTSA